MLPSPSIPLPCADTPLHPSLYGVPSDVLNQPVSFFRRRLIAPLIPPPYQRACHPCPPRFLPQHPIKKHDIHAVIILITYRGLQSLTPFYFKDLLPCPTHGLCATGTSLPLSPLPPSLPSPPSLKKHTQEDSLLLSFQSALKSAD